MLRECVVRFSNLVLDVADHWIWKLYPSQQYTVKSAYNNLIVSEVVFNASYKHILWIKPVPLKVNIFFLLAFVFQIGLKPNPAPLGSDPSSLSR